MKAVALIALCAAAGWGSDLGLVGAKIYVSPDAPAIADGTVVIHDGVIAAVGNRARVKLPRGATVLDCRGLSITAGFWNSHVHILTPELLQAAERPSEELSHQLERMFTRWGFTTVFDLASVLANTNNIRGRIAKGDVRGPRILTAGEPFYPQGGTPVYIKGFLEEHRIPSAEVATVAQALDRVHQEIHDRADGIKLFTGAIVAGGVLVMPLDIAKAVAAEAHAAGKPVFAHPSNTPGLNVAIESGVDILAHTAPMAGPWNADLVQRLKAANMALIPTLSMFHGEMEKEKVSPQATNALLDLVVQQLRAYSNAGGEILFGTDVGYTDRFDTSEEFQLMSRAGMDFKRILAALTKNPAHRFGYEKSGRVATGFEADLTVLEGDPALDLGAFSKVRYTIRNGRVIYPGY